MVKQQKVLAERAVSDDPRRLLRLRTKPRVQARKRTALKMLSPKQQTSTEQRPETSGCKPADGTATEGDAAMVVGDDGSEEFLSTGRTGRRNAMPDIMGKNAETNTGTLPDMFGSLTTDSTDATSRSQAGTSGSQQQQQAG